MCLISIGFVFRKSEWSQIISLELKTVWNMGVFFSHICVCHLLLCSVPLTLMAWEAGTDFRLILKQSPTPKAYWRLSSGYVWLTVFLFPPPALAACKQLLAKNPGHCWEKGALGRRISRGSQCQERLELHSPQAAWDILCQHLCPAGKDCSCPGRRVLEAACTRSLWRKNGARYELSTTNQFSACEGILSKTVI